MSIYTVDVVGICSGGEHVTLSLKKNDAHIKTLVITKTDLLTNETDIEEALIFFLRQSIRASGATTLLQAKNAVEAAQWVV